MATDSPAQRQFYAYMVRMDLIKEIDFLKTQGNIPTGSNNVEGRTQYALLAFLQRYVNARFRILTYTCPVADYAPDVTDTAKLKSLVPLLYTDKLSLLAAFDVTIDFDRMIAPFVKSFDAFITALVGAPDGIANDAVKDTLFSKWLYSRPDGFNPNDEHEWISNILGLVFRAILANPTLTILYGLRIPFETLFARVLDRTMRQLHSASEHVNDALLLVANGLVYYPSILAHVVFKMFKSLDISNACLQAFTAPFELRILVALTGRRPLEVPFASLEVEKVPWLSSYKDQMAMLTALHKCNVNGNVALDMIDFDEALTLLYGARKFKSTLFSSDRTVIVMTCSETCRFYNEYLLVGKSAELATSEFTWAHQLLRQAFLPTPLFVLFPVLGAFAADIDNVGKSGRIAPTTHYSLVLVCVSADKKTLRTYRFDSMDPGPGDLQKAASQNTTIADAINVFFKNACNLQIAPTIGRFTKPQNQRGLECATRTLAAIDMLLSLCPLSKPATLEYDNIDKFLGNKTSKEVDDWAHAATLPSINGYYAFTSGISSNSGDNNPHVTALMDGLHKQVNDANDATDVFVVKDATSAVTYRPLRIIWKLTSAEAFTRIHDLTHVVLASDKYPIETLRERAVAVLRAEGGYLFDAALDDVIKMTTPTAADPSDYTADALPVLFTIGAFCIKFGLDAGLTKISFLEKIVNVCWAFGEKRKLLHASGADATTDNDNPTASTLAIFDTNSRVFFEAIGDKTISKVQGILFATAVHAFLAHYPEAEQKVVTDGEVRADRFRKMGLRGANLEIIQAAFLAIDPSATAQPDPEKDARRSLNVIRQKLVAQIFVLARKLIGMADGSGIDGDGKFDQRLIGEPRLPGIKQLTRVDDTMIIITPLMNSLIKEAVDFISVNLIHINKANDDVDVDDNDDDDDDDDENVDPKLSLITGYDRLLQWLGNEANTGPKATNSEVKIETLNLENTDQLARLCLRKKNIAGIKGLKTWASAMIKKKKDALDTSVKAWEDALLNAIEKIRNEKSFRSFCSNCLIVVIDPLTTSSTYAQNPPADLWSVCDTKLSHIANAITDDRENAEASSESSGSSSDESSIYESVESDDDNDDAMHSVDNSSDSDSDIFQDTQEPPPSTKVVPTSHQALLHEAEKRRSRLIAIRDAYRAFTTIYTLFDKDEFDLFYNNYDENLYYDFVVRTINVENARVIEMGKNTGTNMTTHFRGVIDKIGKYVPLFESIASQITTVRTVLDSFVNEKDQMGLDDLKKIRTSGFSMLDKGGSAVAADAAEINHFNNWIIQYIKVASARQVLQKLVVLSDCMKKWKCKADIALNYLAILGKRHELNTPTNSDNISAFDEIADYAIANRGQEILALPQRIISRNSLEMALVNSPPADGSRDSRAFVLEIHAVQKALARACIQFVDNRKAIGREAGTGHTVFYSASSQCVDAVVIAARRYFTAFNARLERCLLDESITGGQQLVWPFTVRSPPPTVIRPLYEDPNVRLAYPPVLTPLQTWASVMNNTDEQEYRNFLTAATRAHDNAEIAARRRALRDEALAVSSSYRHHR